MEIRQQFAALTAVLPAKPLDASASLPGRQPEAQKPGTFSFVDALRQAEQTAISGMTGKADALSVVEALATTELAVETAVAVRDKVVEAYQEILRMPV